jgi:hypothetical protein
VVTAHVVVAAGLFLALSRGMNWITHARSSSVKDQSG